jgi:hypothetical protein
MHTLAEYRAMVTRNKCLWCGNPLPEEIRYYEHADGWLVRGMENKQWLYLYCARCEYEWALWKLGVPR